MPGDFRLDPADPRYPWTDGLDGRQRPGQSPFTPPDVRRDMGDPSPYPMPEEPPAPRDAAAADEWIRVVMATLRALTGKEWAKNKIATFAESLARQFYRPVHLPFQHEMPTIGRAITTLSLATNLAVLATPQTVASIQVQPGEYGFVAMLGMDTQNDILGAGRTDWPNISWDIAVGPSVAAALPVPGYAGMVGQRGQIEDPTRIRVYVPEGFVCVLRATNLSAFVIPGVRGRLDGWTTPISVRMAGRNVAESMSG